MSIYPDGNKKCIFKHNVVNQEVWKSYSYYLMANACIYTNHKPS